MRAALLPANIATMCRLLPPLALALFALGACSEPPTQIVVSVDTDMALGMELDQLRVRVRRERTTGKFENVKTVSTALSASSMRELPFTLALTRTEGGSNTVEVTAEGLLAGELQVERRAIAHFQSGKILGLPLNLVAICRGRKESCGDAQTCNDEGACEAVERSKLVGWDGPPPFDPAPAPPVDAGSDASGAIGNRIAQLALGANHSCVLWASGEVYCWGADGQGQLGFGGCADPQGDGTCRLPHRLELEDVLGVSAGDEFTCVVLTTGQVRCHGRDDAGQLGRPDNESDGGLVAAASDLVAGISDAVWVEAGARFACSFAKDGYGRCWGDNSTRQFRSDVELYEATEPVKAEPWINRQASFGNGFGCTVEDERVLCWGDDTYGQCGEDAGGHPMMWELAIGQGAERVEAGGDHACALMSDHEVRCWGRNNLGQVGQKPDGSSECTAASGTVFCAKEPVVVPELRASALALGKLFSCAISEDAERKVLCWGSNQRGAIDAATTETAIAFHRPVAVKGLPGKARLLAAGGNHACAVMGAADVWCWGANDQDQLGPEAERSPAHAPVRVPLPTPGS